MAAKKEEAVPLDKALVRAFATNERINQFLLENLDEAAWRADPPGGRGRASAAAFASRTAAERVCYRGLRVCLCARSRTLAMRKEAPLSS